MYRGERSARTSIYFFGRQPTLSIGRLSATVSTEISLDVLAYNMKRTINLVGTQKILDTIRA